MIKKNKKIPSDRVLGRIEHKGENLYITEHSAKIPTEENFNLLTRMVSPDDDDPIEKTKVIKKTIEMEEGR